MILQKDGKDGDNSSSSSSRHSSKMEEEKKREAEKRSFEKVCTMYNKYIKLFNFNLCIWLLSFLNFKSYMWKAYCISCRNAALVSLIIDFKSISRQIILVYSNMNIQVHVDKR